MQNNITFCLSQAIVGPAIIPDLTAVRRKDNVMVRVIESVKGSTLSAFGQ
jgi:hypothetical protein